MKQGPPFPINNKLMKATVIRKTTYNGFSWQSTACEPYTVEVLGVPSSPVDPGVIRVRQEDGEEAIVASFALTSDEFDFNRILWAAMLSEEQMQSRAALGILLPQKSLGIIPIQNVPLRSPRKSFRASGRDLYFDLKCTCPYKSDNPELARLMTHTIKLTGYADDNFFDKVNVMPREGVCKCGRKYHYQWFRDGVEADFIS
jgi:hypothetical protein